MNDTTTNNTWSELGRSAFIGLMSLAVGVAVLWGLGFFALWLLDSNGIESVGAIKLATSNMPTSGVPGLLAYTVYGLVSIFFLALCAALLMFLFGLLVLIGQTTVAGFESAGKKVRFWRWQRTRGRVSKHGKF